MSEGKRPGGLTALAVLNFIFGGFGALGSLGMLAILAFINSAAQSGSNPEAAKAQEAMAKAWEETGVGVFYAMLALGTVTAILLIASGVGYLKQKQFLGRTLGNAYAILSLVRSVVMAASVSEGAGGGFTIVTLVFIVYPVLTLVLLNGTFKHDFVN
ncbi:MAG: hypothetical protein ABIP94_21580 [Planctomycetota bacterium]